MGNYEKAEGILDKYSKGKLSAREVQKELKSFGYKADLRGKSNTIPVYPIDGGDGFDVELAKGGAMLKKQMELFERVEGAFDEGGLMDEGGTVDPISGNDVPIGSTQEEVRDDIPAQLSEGEFVFPADVVRYYGLETLMKMRQEAKQGLKLMEAMGQMGNSEEATIPDDIPFDINDLDMEDDGVLEYAQGGVVQAQQGTYVPPFVPTPDNQYGIAGYQTSQFAPRLIDQPVYGGPYVPPPPIDAPMPPIQPPTTPPATTPTPVYQVPTFTQFTGLAQPEPGGYDEMRTYVNDAGMEMQIPFKNGSPIYPIPEGYKVKGEVETAKTTPTTGSGVTTTTQFDNDDGPEYKKMSDFERERRDIQSSDAFKSMYDDVDKRGSLTKAKDFGQDLYKSVLGSRDEERAGYERLSEDLTDYLQQFPTDQRERAAQEFKAAFAEGKQGRTDGTLAEIVDMTTPEAREKLKESGILTTSPDQVRNVTVESTTVLGSTKGVQQYAKDNNISIERVKELMQADPKLAQSIEQMGELKKQGADIQQDNKPKRAEVKASEVTTRGFTKEDKIKYSGSISRQRNEDPDYDPYEDNEIVYSSEVYDPATGRTETINYNSNGIGKNSRGQTTFSSGYLTTDSKGRVTSSAIPGSQEYKDRRDTRNQAKNAGIDTAGKTTGQIQKELKDKRDADARAAQEAASRRSPSGGGGGGNSGQNSDGGVQSGYSADYGGSVGYQDPSGEAMVAKGGLIKKANLAQQMKQSGLASKK